MRGCDIVRLQHLVTGGGLAKSHSSFRAVANDQRLPTVQMKLSKLHTK